VASPESVDMKATENEQMRIAFRFSCTRRLWGGAIDSLVISADVEEWRDYYELRKFLFILPYDRPIAHVNSHHASFLRFVAKSVSGLIGPLNLYFYFPWVSNEVVSYCERSSAAHRKHKGVLLVQPDSMESMLGLLCWPGLKGAQSIAEAYAGDWTLEEAFMPNPRGIFYNYRTWFKRHIGQLRHYFQFHLERPVFRAWSPKHDKVQLKEKLFELALAEGIDLREGKLQHT